MAMPKLSTRQWREVKVDGGRGHGRRSQWRARLQEQNKCNGSFLHGGRRTRTYHDDHDDSVAGRGALEKDNRGGGGGGGGRGRGGWMTVAVEVRQEVFGLCGGVVRSCVLSLREYYYHNYATI